VAPPGQLPVPHAAARAHAARELPGPRRSPGAVPWAEPGSRFTLLFEALAVDVLLSTDVKKAATLLGLTWDEAWHIMERAVMRGRAAKADAMPEVIGVDEKAIAKGHRYMTLVCDLEQGNVEYIGDERRETSLRAYFEAFAPRARDALRAISLDMWLPYINACRQDVPDADRKMVFDRFHIMRHVVDAVNTVRKREHKELLSEGDATLSKSKYLWLYSAENVPESYGTVDTRATRWRSGSVGTSGPRTAGCSR